jgi:ribonuclease HI
MVQVYTDGACFGNPGKIGIGYVIYRDRIRVKQCSLPLGVQTNNFAEYMALIFSLLEVLAMGETACQVFSDSQLLCQQINGGYKVKNNNIYPLFVLAKKIISQFSSFERKHVDREKKKGADKLAKEAAGL